MSKYKLVPVEPTLEMMEAGAEGCGQDLDRDEARGRAFVAYKAMLAAAPAVQGEVVGYVSQRLLDTLRSGKACGITMEDKPDAHNGVTTPLYTAPQPAEQRPAPDVEALLEALTPQALDWMRCGLAANGHLQDGDHPALANLRAALAAHRNQELGETLADRMRAAGMMTIDEMMAGAPLDGFIRDAGVHDLDSYGQWLDKKCRHFLAMQAERELNKDPEDDMYEWVIAHAAAFQEARINFNAARPAKTELQPELAKYQPCGCVVCTCEHETQCQGCGGHHCGTHPVGKLPNPVYQQPAEQQPAPDVAQLVEALELAHMALVGYLPSHRNDITDAAISHCEQALAAYRKQGGDT